MKALFSVFLLALLLLASPAQAAGPLDAVSNARAAVNADDVDAFNAAVDVDAVLQSGLTEGLDLLCTQAASGKLSQNVDPMMALALSGVASDCRPDNPQLLLLRALVQSEAKSFVAAGVGGGYFAGKPNGRVAESGMHSKLLRGMSSARKELLPGKVISQTGDAAEVSATLRDAKAGEFPLRLKVERKNAAWRITEVLNARELVRGAMEAHR